MPNELYWFGISHLAPDGLEFLKNGAHSKLGQGHFQNFFVSDY